MKPPIVRLLIALLGLLLAPLASAHDTGFGHSRWTMFVAATEGGFALEYRVRLAPDEALVEMTLMDRDRDGRVSATEREEYLAGRARQLAAGLPCRDGGGKKVSWRYTGCKLGHSLVRIFRFTLDNAAKSIILEDHNFPHKPGLVRIRHAPGVEIELLDNSDLYHADRVKVKITRAAP